MAILLRSLLAVGSCSNLAFIVDVSVRSQIKRRRLNLKKEKNKSSQSRHNKKNSRKELSSLKKDLKNSKETSIYQKLMSLLISNTRNQRPLQIAVLVLIKTNFTGKI